MNKITKLIIGRIVCIMWVLLFWVLIPVLLLVYRRDTFKDTWKFFWDNIHRAWTEGW